jgi:hypothetical protein
MSKWIVIGAAGILAACACVLGAGHVWHVLLEMHGR